MTFEGSRRLQERDGGTEEETEANKSESVRTEIDQRLKKGPQAPKKEVEAQKQKNEAIGQDAHRTEIEQRRLKGSGACRKLDQKLVEQKLTNDVKGSEAHRTEIDYRCLNYPEALKKKLDAKKKGKANEPKVHRTEMEQ